MKKLIVILLLLPLFCNAQEDKLKHFVVGAAITEVTYFAAYQLTEDVTKSTIIALGTSLLAGVTKELIDDKFCPKDVAATLGGGVMIGIAINIKTLKIRI